MYCVSVQDTLAVTMYCVSVQDTLAVTMYCVSVQDTLAVTMYCVSVQDTLAVVVSQIQMIVQVLLVNMAANVRMVLTATSAFVLKVSLGICKYSLDEK